MTAAAPDPGNDAPDEVWTLADDPDDETALWWPADDPGARERTFRN